MTIEERIECLEAAVTCLSEELNRVRKVTDLQEPCTRIDLKRDKKEFDERIDAFVEQIEQAHLDAAFSKLHFGEDLQEEDSFPFQGRLVFKGWRKPSESETPWAAGEAHCPECGSFLIHPMRESNDMAEWHRPRCSDCGRTGPAKGTEDEAMAAWTEDCTPAKLYNPHGTGDYTPPPGSGIMQMNLENME